MTQLSRTLPYSNFCPTCERSNTADWIEERGRYECDACQREQRINATRFWFVGQRGCGTWPLEISIDATDAFNAVLSLHEQGWHHLKLLSEMRA